MQTLKNKIDNLDVEELTMVINRKINITTDGLNYILEGYFDVSYSENNYSGEELSFIGSLYKLFVIYNGISYTYSDFFQKYDELVNGYKKYKTLDTEVIKQINFFLNYD